MASRKMCKETHRHFTKEEIKMTSPVKIWEIISICEKLFRHILPNNLGFHMIIYQIGKNQILYSSPDDRSRD